MIILSWVANFDNLNYILVLKDNRLETNVLKDRGSEWVWRMNIMMVVLCDHCVVEYLFDDLNVCCLIGKLFMIESRYTMKGRY